MSDAENTRPTLRCGDRQLDLGTRTFVMGIVNVTPDSFSDGGAHLAVDAAVAHALRLNDEGADVLDLGGESTRPGALPVGVDEEIARVVPVIAALVARGVTNLSVDTRNAATAKAALDAGASWINDVSGLAYDPAMAAVAARAEAVVLVHMRGDPRTMQQQTAYGDVVVEVAAHLAAAVDRAAAAGIDPGRVSVDPGIGFAKDLDDNLRLSANLRALRGRAAGVLYGPSRKRFLGTLTGVDDPAQRDAATVGAVVAAAGFGADVVRVHDVRGCRHALLVADAMRRAGTVRRTP